MVTFRETVTVGPGGTVQVKSDHLRPGVEVEVMVVARTPASPPPTTEELARPLTSFIGSAKGNFKSVEEIDAYIRELRDEWED